MPDRDGYPTEEELERIRTWDVLTEGFKPLMDYVRGVWWAADWGWTEKLEPEEDGGTPVPTYYISTGGWSGNEETMRVLAKNFLFWSQCWESHRRGGHYVFRIPEHLLAYPLAGEPATKEGEGDG